MPRTRSAKTAPIEPAEAATQVTTSKITLASRSGPSPKLFILPKEATSDARIVCLPNPRHGRPARYLVCPKTGIYEFIKISAPKSDPRSWLIETRDKSENSSPDSTTVGAQTVSDADLFLATPIDPLFLVLPALAETKTSKTSDGRQQLFRSSDDYFDQLPEESSHFPQILCWPATRSLIESRMAAICDSVEAGDESVFRLSEEKLLQVMLDKARKMGEGGLPASMEDKFVKRALEAPIQLPSRESKTDGNSTPGDQGDSQETLITETADSQSSAVTKNSDTSITSHSTVATSLAGADEAADTVANAMEAPLDIVNLQRQRVSFDFICSNYVSQPIAARLQASLKASSRVDFSPLDDYLADIAKLRAEAVTAGAFSDYTNKRMRDEEEDEARAEKKRRLEEEKKRKASESRGVRELKKVNTSGMKKLSAFFKAK
ncbi:hypothetical protein HIM_06018 [Hirsutella minnesotensis 3608]|uniref:Ribonuclease H2 subunit B n=1 Tax=Hirsutella minnesotensis 3608 TaxID=1043627 RepID=A0A0F7ZUD4_9HYPO|nr:hypothetical protein HIM_06018 [Hirsutella minnesotensis 3608]